MIVNSYDPDRDALLNPGHNAQRDEGFPKTVIITFNQGLINTLKSQYKSYHHHLTSIKSGDDIPLYQIDYDGKNIAVCNAILGAPLCVTLMEELIVKGTENFVVFGSCGVLDNAIPANALIVPTSAYRDEGTSYHYAEASEWIDVPTAAVTASVLESINIPFVSGKTWTTDAIYRETRRNAAKRKSVGCIAVDMECSAVMALAKFRGVNVYQFFYSKDSLGAEKWDGRLEERLDADRRGRFLWVALEVASAIY